MTGQLCFLIYARKPQYQVSLVYIHLSISQDSKSSLER